jgi:hypothetical protein
MLFQSIDAARLNGKPLGGIQTERGLVHEMQLMVMHSNALLCWPDLRQGRRNEQCIRMPSRAEVVSGKLISSCPMRSNALVCWRGLINDIACGQASERLSVPNDLRQADRVLPAHRSISLAAQPARPEKPLAWYGFHRAICLLDSCRREGIAQLLRSMLQLAQLALLTFLLIYFGTFRFIGFAVL